MTNKTKQKRKSLHNRLAKQSTWLPPMLIALLALIPRAYDLPRFVTADEAKWVYRSAQFLAALLAGDFANTSVNLTPAVTTTWLGALGLSGYYYLNQATLALPFREWLLTLPEFRTELDILVATRWPMVWLNVCGILLIYWLIRRRLSPTVAFIAAMLIALDPHTISLGRILGHDWPTALFMTLALLWLLPQTTVSSTDTPLPLRAVLLSAICAGLACLSKAPAFFLIPFVGLMTTRQPTVSSNKLGPMLARFMLWLMAAYLTFVLMWPAAWVDPLGAPYRVIENAFLSATDRQEAAAEGYWLVPNLGPFYYLVYAGFKLSPLVLLGTAFALVMAWPRRSGDKTRRQTMGWLMAFCLLFTLFMTMSDKRSPRYILPIFPPLAIVAAWGWQTFLEQQWPTLSDPLRRAFVSLLTLSAGVIMLPSVPYYFSYYNPLLGGSLTAPRLVKIGWGEGLDQAARFLQRTAPDSRVGTAYASTVAPYFQGDIASLSSPHLDYLILYRKQIQSGRPSPEFLRYFAAQPAAFMVNLNNIDYAKIYRGPSLTLTDGNQQGVIGFRALSPYGRISETLTVDVVWSAETTINQATVSLKSPRPPPHSERERPHPLPVGEGKRDSATVGPLRIMGQPAALEHSANGLIVSRHTLNLPPTLERGIYMVELNQHPLGEVELRRFSLPDDLSTATQEGELFGKQIALMGYQFGPHESHISLTLAWQARKSRLPNYTVFVQLIDVASNERIIGLDSQPEQGRWPTSQWVQGEVIVDPYRLDLPPDFADGRYALIMGLYHSSTGQRLTLPDGRDHWTLPWTLIREKR